MARALWKGAISFGLIYVPVELHTASKDNTLPLHMLDSRDFAPVGYQRINKKTGKEVDWAHIVKGYEYRKGEFVALADADFKHANVKASETIEIDTFCDERRRGSLAIGTPVQHQNQHRRTHDGKAAGAKHARRLRRRQVQGYVPGRSQKARTGENSERRDAFIGRGGTGERPAAKVEVVKSWAVTKGPSPDNRERTHSAAPIQAPNTGGEYCSEGNPHNEWDACPSGCRVNFICLTDIFHAARNHGGRGHRTRSELAAFEK